MRTWEEVNELFQKAQETLVATAKEAQRTFWMDFDIMYWRLQELAPIAFYRSDAMEFLRERGLDTYEGLESRYRKVIETASIRDRQKLDKMFDKWDHTDPMLNGIWGSMLNIYDFLVAIPNVPQPPDPSRPTILGMFLSGLQHVTTNEFLFIKPASDNIVLHPALTLGTLLGMNSQTTDGRLVRDLYAWDPPAAAGTSATPVSRTLTFEDFRIHNAVSFGPDRLLLTGELLIMGGETDPEGAEMINVQYNPFERDQGTFLITRNNQMEKLSAMQDPDFMRVLTTNVILSR